MELLLWRWSTTAQIFSALTIAIFFVVLIRSVRRMELVPWVAAWLANLGALAVTCVFWLGQPTDPGTFTILRFAYFFSKTMFVACLTIGAARFALQRRVQVSKTLVVAIAAGCVVAAVVLNGIVYIGVAQSTAIAISLGIGAGLLLMRHSAGAAWLAAGFSVRAILALVEAVAYASRIVPNAWSTDKSIDIFLAAHSSLDTAAEWVIALGCLLMLHRVIQRELTDANRDLIATKEILQGLVDRDPLTGLANRRALDLSWPDLVKSGASVVFFDINDFKKINDSYGHSVGDEFLRRFARSLTATFASSDRLIRYAGDEFLVVAAGDHQERLESLVRALRERLRFEDKSGPEIRFASGASQLGVGGDPALCLKAADEAMYRDKQTKSARA